VPDSLKVTIDDMFNKVVLYDHKINNVDMELLDCGDYLITVEFSTEKVYYDEVGVPTRTEYEGWIEIGFVDAAGDMYHLVRIPVTEKEMVFEFVHMIQPTQVVLNPYFLTLDLSPHENVHGGTRRGEVNHMSLQIEI
jgi:hypothetical protein